MPDDLSVDASAYANHWSGADTELHVVGLEKILANYGGFDIAGKVPAKS
jgi:hypothetical protein